MSRSVVGLIMRGEILEKTVGQGHSDIELILRTGLNRLFSLYEKLTVYAWEQAEAVDRNDLTALEKSLDSSRAAIMEAEEIKGLLQPVLDAIAEHYKDGEGLKKFCVEDDSRTDILDIFAKTSDMAAAFSDINRSNTARISERLEGIKKTAAQLTQGRKMARTLRRMETGHEGSPLFFDKKS